MLFFSQQYSHLLWFSHSAHTTISNVRQLWTLYVLGNIFPHWFSTCYMNKCLGHQWQTKVITPPKCGLPNQRAHWSYLQVLRWVRAEVIWIKSKSIISSVFESLVADGGTVWGAFRECSLAGRSMSVGVALRDLEPYPTCSLLFVLCGAEMWSCSFLLLLPFFQLAAMSPRYWDL